MSCGNTESATQSYSHFLMTEKTQANMSESLTLYYFKRIITFDNISTAEPLRNHIFYYPSNIWTSLTQKMTCGWKIIKCYILIIV